MLHFYIEITDIKIERHIRRREGKIERRRADLSFVSVIIIKTNRKFPTIVTILRGVMANMGIVHSPAGLRLRMAWNGIWHIGGPGAGQGCWQEDECEIGRLFARSRRPGVCVCVSLSIM